MLEEAIQRLIDLGQETRAIALVYEDDYRRVYNVGGKLEAVDKTPPPYSLTTYDLDDFCNALGWLSPGKAVGDGVSVWIGKSEIVGVLNIDNRLDRITMPLRLNPVYERLVKLEKETLDQQQVIALLKYELEGVIGGAELLSAVRHIKFRSGASGESNIQHGRESLGRSIDAEVTGASDLPETSTVACRVFKDMEQIGDTDIVCHLQILPEQQKFRFRPAVNALNDSMRRQVDDIRHYISDNIGTDQVFSGQP